jgi:hypothetical protein
MLHHVRPTRNQNIDTSRSRISTWWTLNISPYHLTRTSFHRSLSFFTRTSLLICLTEWRAARAAPPQARQRQPPADRPSSASGPAPISGGRRASGRLYTVLARRSSLWPGHAGGCLRAELACTGGARACRRSSLPNKISTTQAQAIVPQ